MEGYLLRLVLGSHELSCLFSSTCSISDYDPIYVQSVKVNGEPYKSNCYLDFDVFESASAIELTLSNNINLDCGKGPEAIPPSLSTGGFGGI